MFIILEKILIQLNLNLRINFTKKCLNFFHIPLKTMIQLPHFCPSLPLVNYVKLFLKSYPSLATSPISLVQDTI